MKITKIGRYNISGELGRGSMGVVYKGHDSTLDREVAIKMINVTENSTDTKEKLSIERLYQEARIAGQLSHPNIATIFDVSEDNGVHFIVMEYVNGVSLEKVIIENRTIHFIDKLRIIALIGTALHYAHQRRIIHKDIKPANIMLVNDMQVKIMDFGIANFISKDDLSGTISGEVMGSPYYMSPEQFKNKSLDRRTDIFSLGILSYQFLTGKRPFEANNLVELFKDIESHTPKAPSIFNTDITPQINDTILKSIKSRKEERYNSASQFVDTLEIFINQLEMAETSEISTEKDGYDKENLLDSLRKNYVFFSDFSNTELKQIFKISKKKIYKKGTVVFKEDTVGNSMYIIISGNINITKRFSGRDITHLTTLKAGDCFGEMGIIDYASRFATAAVISDCLLISINEVILRSSEPMLCLKLYKNLSSILSEKLRKSDITNNELKVKLNEEKT